MDNDHFTVICPRCGSEMDSNARYCMKCGNLNANHEDNRGMLKYIKDNNEGYVVGSGKFISTVDDSSNTNCFTSVSRDIGNYNVCFIVNLIGYLLTTLIIFLVSGSSGSGQLSDIFNINLFIRLVVNSLIFIYFYGMELIFMKLNKKWWYALIPIYNWMVLTKSVFNNYLLGLLVLIPFVGQIFSLVLLYKLAKGFKKNGFLMILFFPIMFLIIAYGSSSFKNIIYVSSAENGLEKDYRKKKFFWYLCIFIPLFSGILYVVFNFNYVKENILEKSSYMYLYITSKIVSNKVIDNYEEGEYTCTCSNSPTKTFIYEDVASEFYIPLSSFNDPVNMSVSVVAKNGKNDYYVSISNGKYGLYSVLVDNIKLYSFCKIGQLDIVNNTCSCSLK